MLKTESGNAYPEKIKPVLEMMVERIVKKFNPVQIILFGSHARNAPHQDSDIDLFIVLDHIENKVSVHVIWTYFLAPASIIINNAHISKKIIG